MALGTQSGNIRRLILGYALRLTLVGLGIGISGVLTLSRAMESMLYGVAPSVILIALGAAWIPVRLAVRIDPAEALRAE